MKITLTKEEYLKLFGLIYIGDWILHSYNMDEKEETMEYRKAMEKYSSFAEEFGCEDLVENYPDGVGVHTYLNQYDNEVFWDELVERLAKRDLVNKHNKTVITRVYKDESLFRELEEIKKRYHDEFGNNGIKNLKIYD